MWFCKGGEHDMRPLPNVRLGRQHQTKTTGGGEAQRRNHARAARRTTRHDRFNGNRLSCARRWPAIHVSDERRQRSCRPYVLAASIFRQIGRAGILGHALPVNQALARPRAGGGQPIPHGRNRSGPVRPHVAPPVAIQSWRHSARIRDPHDCNGLALKQWKCLRRGAMRPQRYSMIHGGPQEMPDHARCREAKEDRMPD
jgi:hypothetical protein